jgi:hypothetical protein
LRYILFLFLLFVSVSLVWCEPQAPAPSGFDQLVGKKFLLLVPVYKRPFGMAPGDPTIFDEDKGPQFKEGMHTRSAPSKDMFKVIDNEDVIITKAEWKGDEADFYLRSESGKEGKISFHFKNASSFDAMFRKVFDQRATYSFELLTGGLELTDDLVTVTIQPGTQGIGLRIKNNSEEPLKIDWTSASIVDPNGNAQSVIHYGTKLINKDDYQKPTTIPPSAAINDILVPSNSVEWTDSGWRFLRLFSLAASNARSLNGKEISVFLPIQIAGKPDHNLNLKLKMKVSEQR